LPTIEFTANLHRHVECPKEQLDADTLAACLDDYFSRWPGVRGFILDDQGAIRHHVKILIDGRNIRDRKKLTDTLEPASQIHVFQALSGG
jgi:molybdopterin converting factor small subunit